MTTTPHSIRQASTALIHDTRSVKKDGTYPVKLRITFNRKQKYYPTGKHLTELDFIRTFGDKPRGEIKEMRLYLEAIEQKAKSVINDMPNFSFEAFEKIFLSKNSDYQNVFSAYRRVIDIMNAQGRVGNASAYECSRNSLKEFYKKELLNFDTITVDFLNAYEKYMLSKGNSLTTIGIYLRQLRVLFNEAIELGTIKSDSYPFGKRRYQIPSGRNVKKALTLSEIGKIFRYQANSLTKEAWARDMWMFSYLCSGINVKDIARLRYKDIDGEYIHFVRSKTERTTRKQLKPITIILSPEAKAIIDRWGNKPDYPSQYVFDILTDGVTPLKEQALVRQATKTINIYIKRIANAVGIDKNVSSYFARHSFATVLKRSGASIEFISESLGHSNLKTTESYLDAFTDDIKREYTKLLTAF